MEYTEEFEQFWKLYPSRWNRDLGTSVKRKKRPAFMKWQLLPQEIRDECLAKVKYIKSSEGGAVRDAVTWINQFGWEDIDLPEPPPKPVIPKQLTGQVFKQLPPKESLNDGRNRCMQGLQKVKGKYE